MDFKNNLILHTIKTSLLNSIYCYSLLTIYSYLTYAKYPLFLLLLCTLAIPPYIPKPITRLVLWM